MLDEALPTFFLKSTRQSYLKSIYFCQHGNDPSPAYSLRHADPSTPDGKNRYAVALVDPYVPDIIYGEILIIPEWTQPSLSADAIRANGGVTPPPEPLLPTRFTVHLYNPDQQVTVEFKPKSWNSPATWTFEMPQHTFRQPSSSSLDRTQTDPAAADTTPKLRFNWRRDSKLSKDLTCYLSGKTTSMTENKNKAKSKEPDIIMSIFKGLREMTLYEPNMYRVEMEDFKGLEVVLLLGAVAIRDVYFSTMKDSFNLSKQAASMAAPPVSTSIPTSGPSAATSVATAVNGNHRPSLPPINTTSHQKQNIPVASGGLNAVPTQSPPQPSKPTSSSTKPKPSNQQRKEEERRTQKLLEDEDKARRKRQAEIDQETRRLQRLYGEEEHRARTHTPSLPPRASGARPQQPSSSRPQAPPQPRPMQPNGRGAPAQRYYHYHHHSPSTPHIPSGPYLSPPSGRRPDPRQQSTVTFATPDGPVGTTTGVRPTVQPKKSSFFGFRKSGDEREREKLSKKRSSMF
ncbi:hypothetical protein N8T08_003063 [Aspergillus melleus]|uniref:Uncharacterized protein n=1 Tax=Aspergillus melleus TaxID=138277 RepID=A0ACC3B7S3_9EURO|nr:hypothetical protein N8T08_003063 [Aspergillus melleus]